MHDDPIVRQKAGKIFLERILAEMAEETDELNQVVMKHNAPLREFMSKIEISFGPVEHYSADYDENEVISYAAKFDDPQFSPVSEYGMVQLPLPAFPPFPLTKITGSSSGGMRLLIANQTVGILNMDNAEIFFRDDEVLFNVFGYHLGKFELCGDISNNNALDDSDTMFVPTTLKFQDGAMAKSVFGLHINRLKLISAESPENPSSRHEDNELRRAVIHAMGTDDDLLKLKANSNLAFQVHAIDFIRAELDKVRLMFDGTELLINLSSGSATRLDGDDAWGLPIDDLCIDEMESVSISISGIPLDQRWDIGYDVHVAEYDEEDEDDRQIVLLGAHFYPNVMIQGFTYADDLSDYDVTDDNFVEDFEYAWSNGDVQVDFHVFAIVMKLKDIKDTLEVLGIDTQKTPAADAQHQS